MAVTPAGAEVSNAVATNWKKIWKKHLRPLADRRYYTKAQSDTKYATKAESAAGDAASNAATDSKLSGYYKKTETYSKAEADAKYVARAALITGSWGFGGAASGAYAIESINYGAVLSAVPTVHFINEGGVAPAQCPGTAAAPNATAGHLCVWAQSNTSISGPYIFNERADSALVSGLSTAASSYIYGTWAVRPAGFAPALSLAKSSPLSTTGTQPGR